MVIGVVMPVTVHFDMAIESLATIKSNRYHWQPYIWIQRKGDRLPLAGVWNWGIGKAFENNCDLVLVINDDILFAPYTLDVMVGSAIDGQYGFVSASNVRDELDRPRAILKYPQPPEGTQTLDYSAFMIDEDTYDKVGVFDENFDPIYFEDNDYTYRMKLAGIKYAGLTQAAYFHYGSQTHHELVRTEGGNERARLFQKNAAYFQKKWGGSPGNERYLTPFNK